jgi:hypothetical protein
LDDKILGLNVLDMVFECPLHRNGKIEKPKKEIEEVQKALVEVGFHAAVPPIREVVIVELAQGEKEETSIQKEKILECVVCFGPLNCVLVPCGHVCCMVCGEQLKVCPICRMAIGSRQKMYLP